MRSLLVLSAVVLVAAWTAQAFASRRFSEDIDGLRRDLLASQVRPPGAPSDLPPLIRAFAERNGGHRDGSSAMRMTQDVEMRMKPGARPFPLTATQDSGTSVPGFVWDARGRWSMIVPLRVVDAYVAGAGRLEVRIAGAIPVARASGPSTDRGEALRFLAELAWNPDAILTASGLEWRQIDATTVEVSLRMAGGVVRVNQLFDAAGDIVGIVSEDRPYTVGGKDVPTRWIGRFWDYRHEGAYRWPHRGEVAWVLPEGEFVYWRGEITGLRAAGR